jgi:hypothetical protein
VPEASVLSDALVRDLMAVGQVDVLVGVPTLNNAATIGGVVGAVTEAFARYFPRDRTLLLNSDGGSTDGTTAMVRTAAPGEGGAMTLSHRLRTEHRITTPYHGLPGKGSALRQILTVADLTQARAVAVLDADMAAVTPEWIVALLRPVLDERYDYVGPIYARLPTDGLLVTQVVRPLIRATYGWQVQEPLAAEFGCSGGFLTHCLEQPVWEDELARYGIDLWITGEALSGGFRCCQAPLGPRVQPTALDRPGFPQVFTQVVGATFDCLETHAPYWLSRAGSEPLPVIGSPLGEAPDPPAIDPKRLLKSFAQDVKNLAAVLESIVSPEVLAGLRKAAAATGRLRFQDELWAATVYDFLLAHHHGVMRHEHIAQALMPLYLGRAGSFLQQYGAADPAAVTKALESVCLAFEARKAAVTDRWAQTNPR